MADCGLDLVTQGFPGALLTRENARITVPSSADVEEEMEFHYGAGGMGAGNGMSSSYGYGSETGGDPDSFLFGGGEELEEGVMSLEQISEDVNAENNANATSSSAASSAMMSANTSSNSSTATLELTEEQQAELDSALFLDEQLYIQKAAAAAAGHKLKQVAAELAPALVVEYGVTKAVYFDLSEVACLFSENSTCVPEQLTNIMYENAEHDDEESYAVHSASILSRHHVLVVILYHGQDGSVLPTWSSLDVKFTVRVMQTARSETRVATFTLRVLANPHSATTSSSAESADAASQLPPVDPLLIPEGMGSIAARFAHSCGVAELAESERAGDCGNEVSLRTALDSAEILPFPYRDSSLPVFDEGTILALSLAVPNAALLEMAGSTSAVVTYRFTSKHGEVQRYALPLREALYSFPASAAIPACNVSSIVDDLAFRQNIETSEAEIEEMIKKVQQFDPPGVCARNLQECLLIQLEKRVEQGDHVDMAIKVLDKYFDEFTKKHYEKIQRGLNIDDEQLRQIINQIIKLNPKPGGNIGEAKTAEGYVIPDFFIINNNGKLELTLNSRNAPDLRISEGYRDMLKDYDKGNKKDRRQKEAVLFIKQKIDSAKWFIDAIKQRQHTLITTMEAIMNYQYEFFLTGDDTEMRPMILKDIAELTNLDISTVSRVANSKFVQTEFGTYRLKFFFSESLQTDSGEEVSTREVKKILSDLIEGESKKNPLSDERLTELLQEKGYNIARRTVAKYREQLNIPVARLRKEL